MKKRWERLDGFTFWEFTTFLYLAPILTYWNVSRACKLERTACLSEVLQSKWYKLDELKWLWGFVFQSSWMVVTVLWLYSSRNGIGQEMSYWQSGGEVYKTPRCYGVSSCINAECNFLLCALVTFLYKIVLYLHLYASITFKKSSSKKYEMSWSLFSFTFAICYWIPSY